MSKKKKNVESGPLTLERFLSTCFLVPMGKNPLDPACLWGLPVMLHGSPGIGKTSRIHQAARTVGLKCLPVELGGRQPEDASGAPFLTHDDKLVIACLLGAVNELNEIGEGVLFLDELTCARPATQGAFLSAVQERRVGDTQFSNLIRVVCAGNPPNEAAGGYQLQLPMANRMAHRDVPPPTVAEYIKYRNGVMEEEKDQFHSNMQKIMSEWANIEPSVKALEDGFLKRSPDSLFAIPKPGNPNRGKAFPTPRSFEAAMNAVVTARILGLDIEQQSELVAACIGEGPATEWSTWVHEADLPDPYDMLTKGWAPDVDRLDRTEVAISAAVKYLISRDKKEGLELAPGAWRLLQGLINAGVPDVGVSFSSLLLKSGFGSRATAEISEQARPVMLRFGQMGLEEYAGN